MQAADARVAQIAENQLAGDLEVEVGERAVDRVDAGVVDQVVEPTVAVDRVAQHRPAMLGVGGVQPIHPDVRIVTATNVPIEP